MPSEKSVSEISELLERAKERVAAMSHAEHAAMIETQRQSWSRGMAPCEHGVSDWEDCTECRRLALQESGK